MSALPLSRPWVTDDEVRLVTESLTSGQTAGDGPFTKRVSAALREQMLGARVLLTTSCTSALEMAALLLRRRFAHIAQPEVILPSFTFVSTANAFLLHGFTLRFCDVDPTDGNFTVASVQALLNANTVAVVPVHYAGHPGDMAGLRAALSGSQAVIVEDAAQALFAARDGQPAGTFGALACFSFHATKNFQCGEGGALVLNDASYVEAAEILREKGTNRSQFLLGHVDKYTWVDVGSSFLSADPLAALLLAQIGAKERISQLRAERAQQYQAALLPLVSSHKLRILATPKGVASNNHLFAIVLPSLDVRNRLMLTLNQQGIGAAFHYPPLHLTPVGKRVHDARPLPGSETLGDCLLRLPLFPAMSNSDVTRVVDAIAAFFA